MRNITSKMISRALDGDAVSSMHEYLIISGILMLMMVILAFSFTTVLIEPQSRQLTEYAFIDIGNGVSTRIVDLYVIAPYNGTITTYFDLPDDVAGKDYYVSISSSATGDYVSVYRDTIKRDVSLAGIGETMGVGGTTPGHGLNRISYRSEGFT